MPLAYHVPFLLLHSQFPDALTNDVYRENVKKNIICNAVDDLLGVSPNNVPHLPVACTAALMRIDSYGPSTPIPPGNVDQRDAKLLMTNLDILHGCRRSLVKYFAKQIPCKCLDEMYAQVRSTTPKIGMCAYDKCGQIKARTSLFICTGCERIVYCLHM